MIFVFPRLKAVKAISSINLVLPEPVDPSTKPPYITVRPKDDAPVLVDRLLKPDGLPDRRVRHDTQTENSRVPHIRILLDHEVLDLTTETSGDPRQLRLHLLKVLNTRHQL
jgi:hypothetical protein